ncbi:MAG: hypothetical protein HZA31_08315 [Opitutae bacterium]|nr:hypothetical protein [Opitutae bacterium]
MNPPTASGTQLSFLSDTTPNRPALANPRMAANLLQRLLGQDELAATADPTLVSFFQAIFPPAVAAAERKHGLPVSKTTLRPFLDDPLAAIAFLPPMRPDEVERTDMLLGFVQSRLEAEKDRTRIAAAVERLLGARVPEMLITPDGIPSPLYASDRSEASEVFAPLIATVPPQAAECLVESFVLLRAAHHSDVQAGIAKLFWRQSTGPAEPYIAGCPDGRARAFFADMWKKSEESQRQIYAAVDLANLYAVFGAKP